MVKNRQNLPNKKGGNARKDASPGGVYRVEAVSVKKARFSGGAGRGEERDEMDKRMADLLLLFGEKMVQS